MRSKAQQALYDQGLRRCSKCGTVAPITTFLEITKRGKKVRHTYCTDCRVAKVREWETRNADKRARYEFERRCRRYGITPIRYEQLMLEQKGLCLICHLPDLTGRGLCVDHDHTTGTIRGLLCSPCNLGLGQYRDDPRLLRSAAAYLERANVLVH